MMIYALLILSVATLNSSHSNDGMAKLPKPTHQELDAAEKHADKFNGKGFPTTAKGFGKGADAYRKLGQMKERAGYRSRGDLERAEVFSDHAHSATQPGFTKKNVENFDKAHQAYFDEDYREDDRDKKDYKKLAEHAATAAAAARKIGGRAYDKEAANFDVKAEKANSKVFESDKSIEPTVIRKDSDEEHSVVRHDESDE